MKRTQFKNEGFTLIELIIYIAFLAAITLLAIESIVSVMKGLSAMRVDQSINESATTALERISRETRNALSVDTTNSILNTNPGKLVLNTLDASSTVIAMEFYVANGQIGIRKAGVDAGSLMTKYATTTSLIFRQSTTTNSTAIKVELSLQDTRSSSTTPPLSFYDTIILRGTVH